MTRKCPTCGGDGIVVSEHTAAVDVERRLKALVTPGSRAKAFRVEVAARVAWLVAGPGGSRLHELEETTKRRFFLVGKEGEHLDHFRVLDQGTLEKVAPKLPVDVGQEVEVKLGEVGLHDPHAGTGKVDDVDVVVGEAAKLVGKKVKARITAVTDGLAWAELVAPVEKAEEPLTAEAEAEKPTRPRRAAAPKKEAQAVEAAEAEPDVEAEAEAEAEESVEVELDGDEPPAKKKTRRGSRGGRNRKKKTATVGSAASENGSEPQEAPDAEPVSGTGAEPEAPVIHVPDRDLGAEEADGDTPSPQRKRTRRGSRGGRNRKKKTATVATASGNGREPEAEAEPESESESERKPEPRPEPEPERDGGEWTYTPMSEWGIDQ